MPKEIINICLLASIGFLFSFKGSDFKAGQLKYARVKAAYQSSWNALQAFLRAKQVDPANFDLYLRTFKYEKTVELWVTNSLKKAYDHFELNHSLPKISTDKNGDYQIAAN